MKESTIEKVVSNYAKSKGWLSFKFVSPSNRGVPDRIFLKRGKIIFIEFKATGKKLTKLQKFKIDQIRDGGFFLVCIIDLIEKGKQIFDK